MAIEFHKSPRPKYLQAGAFVSVAAILLAIGFAGGVKPWDRSDGEHQSSSVSPVEQQPQVADPYSAPRSPDLDDPVVLRVHNPGVANDVAVQVAMDQHIAAALGSSSGGNVAVVVASNWLSDAELNELNQVRASLGEPPLRVVDVW